MLKRVHSMDNNEPKVDSHAINNTSNETDNFVFEMLTTETNSRNTPQVSNITSLSNVRNNVINSTIPRGTLKQVAVKICSLLKVWRISTHSDIADILIMEYLGPVDQEKYASDILYQKSRESSEKSIRRRVYDAINVLISATIIGRSGKSITWQGISHFLNSLRPTNIDKCINPPNLQSIQKQLHENIDKYERLQYTLSSLKTIIEYNSKNKISNEQIKLPSCILVTNSSDIVNIKCTYFNNRKSVAIQTTNIVDFLDQFDIINRIAMNIRLKEP
ncbi:transcription factor E2F dimerization partner domain-containing protein [Cryptosporidium andersoni]|uniref:Transcription factor E2F dimerization partner domain-containing protein n=1 Tax=Cryptosporidium andersoni TaxID=117008 RepID=A0A1J4MIE7_9CRYT|nr:transcription factor E2F dimerization partner domain-containing protein [Cryptosporidium andersoni]